MLAVKKNVFSAVLKLSKDGELRTEHGNRFHAAGPATMNARLPNFVLVRWTTRSPRADDRVRPSMHELSQSSLISTIRLWWLVIKTVYCWTFVCKAVGISCHSLYSKLLSVSCFNGHFSGGPRQ